MSLYHCRPTAFTTALTYLATSSSLVFTVRVRVHVCVGSYAASCTSGANSSSCVCVGCGCVRACAASNFLGVTVFGG